MTELDGTRTVARALNARLSTQSTVAAPGERPNRRCLACLQADLSVVAANDDFYEQFGRSSADVCGRSLYDLLHPGSPAVLDRHFARLAESGDAHFVERVLGKRGSEGMFTGEVTGIAVRDEDAELSAIIVLVTPDESTEPAEGTPPGRWPTTGRRKSLLTDLDAKILEGVAAGASTVQLATRMYMSRQGVEYHVGTMLRKLRVSNRAALVSRAYSMGLLVAGSWPPRVAPGVVGH